MEAKIVKASFRECSIEDRKRFPSSKCLLPISVGQKTHEGKKFLATIKLINKYFKECVILIDDSIQRHTVKIHHPHISDSEAYQTAINEGNMWLKRNKEIYSQLTIPFHIIQIFILLS